MPLPHPFRCANITQESGKFSICTIDNGLTQYFSSIYRVHNHRVSDSSKPLVTLCCFRIRRFIKPPQILHINICRGVLQNFTGKWIRLSLLVHGTGKIITESSAAFPTLFKEILVQLIFGVGNFSSLVTCLRQEFLYLSTLFRNLVNLFLDFCIFGVQRKHAFHITVAAKILINEILVIYQRQII